MASVSFIGVAKVYPDGTRAVSDLNLEVGDGEFMVLVGPSGCGKTTALRMVAGLEDISSGEVLIGDVVVNRVEPRKRDIAMVFQNYALYPHMSVYDNLAFPLRCRAVRKGDIASRVKIVARLLGLEQHLRRKPRTLSGGQRQRVAMGRAIVREPEVFLMDEPLSNLDAKLRVQMRGEISRLQRDLKVTTVYVTHDQIEAMTMGTGIAVMRKGVLQQHGEARHVYDRPANLFVASFIGSPTMNLFQAHVEPWNDGLACVVGSAAGPTQTLRLPPRLLDGKWRLGDYCGRKIAVGIRPEHVTSVTGTEAAAQLTGTVIDVEELGSETLAYVEMAAERVVTDAVVEVAEDIDEAAVMALVDEAAEHRVTVIARLERDGYVKPGMPLTVAVGVDRLHFFDLDTGESLLR